MSRFNLAWLITVPLAMLLGVSLSFTAPSRQNDQEYKLVRTVVDVLAEVDQHFVRPLDEDQKQKLVEDMINGGLDRLDPYSQYMNSDELRQFNAQTEGNFGGIGIHLGIDPRSGLPLVISPMVGTPAHEAGILAGDSDEAQLLDVTPHDIGIRVGEAGFATVLPRNSMLPVRARRLFATTSDNQKFVSIEPYQGESSDVSHNRKLGQVVLDDEAVGLQHAGAMARQGDGAEQVFAGVDGAAGRQLQLAAVLAEQPGHRLAVARQQELQAVVRGQVGRRARRAVARQIVRRGHHHQFRIAELARDQAGIGLGAAAHRNLQFRADGGLVGRDKAERDGFAQ